MSAPLRLTASCAIALAVASGCASDAPQSIPETLGASDSAQPILETLARFEFEVEPAWQGSRTFRSHARVIGRLIRGGAPYSGEVTVAVGDEDQPGWPPQVARSIRTEPDGRFEIARGCERKDSDAWLLVASVDRGWCARVIDLELVADQVTDVGDLELLPTRAIEIVIADVRTGTPLEEVEVLVSPIGASRIAMSYLMVGAPWECPPRGSSPGGLPLATQEKTTPRGKVRVSGIPPWDVTLAFRRRDYRDTQMSVPAVRQRTGPLEIRMLRFGETRPAYLDDWRVAAR